MKLYLLIFLILFKVSAISIQLYAQPKELKKADEYFDSFNYKKALRLYNNIRDESVALYYVTHKIGDCYRLLGETENAIDWYLKATEYPDVNYATYYMLSHELRKKERYMEAEQYLNEYYKMSGNNKTIEGSLEELILSLKNDSSNYIIHPLSINTEYSEFAPVIYNDQLVFSSNRTSIQMIKREDIRDGSRFYKLYASKRNELISLSEPEFFSQELSSKYNDGPIAFNQDKTIAFTTRNIKSSAKDKSYLNIFVSHKANGKWKSKSSAIPLRQMDFSYMHAFLTEDDMRLFFVSDKEGGYGGYDIYYSEYKNGFLSMPQNLGPNINTEENELFPFVDRDGKLYFSSDKYGGIGGLDVYFSMPEGDGFSQSFNMGYPLNTSSDDFGLILEEEGLSGYFCSNREGGIGEDDIYAFQQKRELNFIRYEGVIVSSNSNDPVNSALVKVYDGSKLISSTETNEQGVFSFYLKSNNNLILQVKKRYFNLFKKDLKTLATPDDQGYRINIVLVEY
ncbi:tetratricopeptide repeat protein [Labilibacter sediminis]|nr:tetratricopeptide repeat protein [Labilibacter sediminis]